MAEEQIVNRIQKLLALASGSSNLNESAIAFAAAQKLLMTHNLNLAQVEATTGMKTSSSEEPITNSEQYLYTGQRVILWKSCLACALCKLNFCEMYINNTYVSGKNQIGYRVVGRKSDIEMVRYFFNSIVTQIEHLSALALTLGQGKGKTFTNNFKHGAFNTVIARLQTTHQEVRKEYASTALVIVDTKAKEVETWISTHLKLKSAKPVHTTTQDLNAYCLGQEAGKKISLNKGLSPNLSNKLLS